MAWGCIMTTLKALHARGVRGAGTVTVTDGAPSELASLLPGSTFTTDPRQTLNSRESVLCLVRYRMDDDLGTRTMGWLVGPRADLWDVARALRRYLTRRRAMLARRRDDTGDPRALLDSLLYHYNPAPCILRKIVADWCTGTTSI